MMLSDVCLSACLSVANIGPKSRTEKPKKTKIVTEVAHVTRDSDTTLKVKRSRSPNRFTQRGFTHQAAAAVKAGESIHRGNLLLRCRRLGGASGGERRGNRGIYDGDRPPTAC